MNNISPWQNAMEALSDDSFFNIIRLYLGEVKTPYNKQRLIQQLASFIRDKNNLNNIISLLDDFDLTVLTAISVISNPSQKAVVEFFSSSYTIAEIYSKLLNLTERLLIFTEKNPYSGAEILRLNPLLEEELRPYLNIKRILPDCTITNFSTDDIFTISPNFMAAFISYIKVYGCSCKNDGIIKKNHLTKLEEIFPGRVDCLQLIFTAFSNLGLVHEGKKSFEFDNAKLSAFAELSEIKQYAFICASASSRLSRDGLKKEAQLLIDTLSSVPVTGMTKNTLLRLAFLIGSRLEDGPELGTKSRFTKMLEAAKTTEKPSEDGINAVNVFNRMLDNAITLGLLIKLGTDEQDEIIFTASTTVQNSLDNKNSTNFANNTNLNSEKIPVLDIDSTFTVTLMPGLKLSQLLPLTSIFVIKNCNVVSEFEINKASISNAFDGGMKPDGISKLLLQYTSYELPQNLIITIEDWYNSYSSAMLYSGYILKVSKENVPIVENNPKINSLIKEKLAEGIYLLTVTSETELAGFMKDSSLDFMGEIRTSTASPAPATFPLLRPAHPLAFQKNDSIEKAESNSTLLAALESQLENMNLVKQTKENLLNKIRNKKIVSEAQLKTTSTRTEILETDGMDYSGKIHLIEAAIENSELMEIQIPSTDANTDSGNPLQPKFVSFVGKPLHLIKNEREVLLNFKAESGFAGEEMENDFITLSVSRITYLKRLRL